MRANNSGEMYIIEGKQTDY